MIEDQAQRQQAIDPAQSFIVQAPAGSGKTELLIQRYLRLLSLVDHPEEIIAITFTRKAAAEMQGRVLRALESAQGNETPVSEHEQQTLQLAKEALDRNGQKNWQLMENPTRLRIQTIDALCGSLSRQMPMLAMLGAQPETIDDPRPLYELAASNTLLELESGQHWSEAIARLLEHLDNDLPRLKRLLIEMLSKRDQWLRYVSAEHDRHDMEAALRNIIQSHLKKVRDKFPKEYESELCELARFAAENLKELKPENATVTCHELEALPSTGFRDLPLWHGVQELLLTQKGSWRKRLNKNNGFPAPSDNKLEADLRQSMKQRIETLLQNLHEVIGLDRTLAQISLLPASDYEDDEWQVIGALCQLLLLAEAQLRVIFTERNQMDFTGITQAAIQALGDEEAPTDLALHLDYQLHHLLVDEYQDISLNQFKLLQQLTAAWSADEQKSLFLVGDPMQSIYRFREAEVALFIQTWKQQRLGQVALTSLRLQVNFRSKQSLVGWVNEQFKSIMPEQDEAVSGAVSYSPSTAFHKGNNNDAVSVHPFMNRSDLEEANKIIALVESLREQDKKASIAILVRSRAHLVQILPSLKEAGVSYQAIDIVSLLNEPYIQDLLSLTRAYIHLADRIAWFAVLRAPWCGMDLKSMTALFAAHKNKTIWQCLNNDKLINQLDERTKQQLCRFNQIFSPVLANKQRQSLRKAVESLWLQLGGPATLLNATELEDVQAYFDVLDKLDEGSELKDLESLMSTMADLYAAPETGAGIQLQVMSMHKAKGLEFDHVILPGLGRRSRGQQAELMMWTMLNQGDEEQLIMAPIKEAGTEDGAVYQYLKQLEQSKQSYEDARLLYVAATRAKHSLHLFAHANEKIDRKSGEISYEPDKRSLLNHLWPSIKDQFDVSDENTTQQNGVTDVTLVDQSMKRFKADWQLPSASIHFDINTSSLEDTEDKVLVEYEWAGENIKHVGSTVHRMIQTMAEEGLGNWNEGRIKNNRSFYVNHLRQLGVNEKDLNWTTNRVIEALTMMLEDERGRWLLSNEHIEIENEYALSGVYNHKIINIKIDRTFVDEQGIRWIVDYKTSRHEEADVDLFLDQEQERYKPQLEKYAAILSSIDNREIRLGLYFPLLKDWREWGYE